MTEINEIMLRPKDISPGNIPLVTNLLKMDLPPLTLHHYAVSIEPQIAKRLNSIVIRSVLDLNKEKFNCAYGFDGNAMLVTNKKIDDIQHEHKVGSKSVIVRMEYKNSYEIKGDSVDITGGKTDTDLDALKKVNTGMQCLEIILRSFQSQKFVVDGRKAVSDQNIDTLSGGIELWHGVSQRIKTFNDRMFLNVDLGHVTFYEPITLLELLGKQMNRGGGRGYNQSAPDLRNVNPNVINQLNKFIKNVKLETIHRERNFKFKCCGITETSAHDTFFELESGRQSVADYFTKAYGPLRHPYLPCLVVKKKDSQIYFPLEVCKIVPNQKYIKKLNDFQTSEVIKKISKPANGRFEDLNRRVGALQISNNEVLSNLNIKVENQFYTTMAKSLHEPEIRFGNSTVRPNRGSWNLRNSKVIKGIAVQKWAVFVLGDESVSQIRGGIDFLVRIGTDMGLKMANPTEIRKCSIDSIQSFIEGKGYELVMVILNDRSAFNYQEIKRICDIKCGVISQCMRKQNIQKLRDGSFCGNLVLKINTKLGGINFTVGDDFDQNPEDTTIMFGLDVTHPGTGDMSANSIAAVVSSLNGSFTKFYTTLKMQPKREEIIENLREIFKEHLQHFFVTTGRKPTKVIIFRDGIGDSHILNCYFREIEQIKLAFKELHSEYDPKIVFAVVQKKHSIRFKLQEDGSNRGGYDQGRGGYDRGGRGAPRPPTGNPSPGTLVDSLGSKYNDFYLVTHFALQGTPCPVKYLILKDEINMPNFSQFIYDQCHVFSRATKAVSVIPVVYYAHLAAARAKCYVEDEKLLEVSPSFKNVMWYL